MHVLLAIAFLLGLTALMAASLLMISLFLRSTRDALARADAQGRRWALRYVAVLAVIGAILIVLTITFEITEP